MSNLLALAQDLETKSKEQQESTEKMLKAAFNEHEKSVKEELNTSKEKISDAIRAHEKGMTEALQSNKKLVLRMVGRTWLTITMVSVLLIGSSGSVLWWQGQKIVSNLETISQQEDALAKLNAKTWGVSYRSDSSGNFLVLPKGVKADTGWSVGTEKRKAIKLVQE
jgi:hypothetical protein